MARITITRQWPDGDVLSVSVKAESNYPDALAQALRTVTDACETRIVGQPEPDHLVPLSKGGSNSSTNILPACRPCNLSKQSMSLSEWAACRERRGRPPVTTSWAIDDPRVQHLTTLADAA